MFIIIGMIFAFSSYGLAQLFYNMGYFHHIWEGGSLEAVLITYLVGLPVFLFSLSRISERTETKIGDGLIFSTLSLYAMLGMPVFALNMESMGLVVAFVAFAISCLTTAVFFILYLWRVENTDT